MQPTATALLRGQHAEHVRGDRQHERERAQADLDPDRQRAGRGHGRTRCVRWHRVRRRDGARHGRGLGSGRTRLGGGVRCGLTGRRRVDRRHGVEAHPAERSERHLRPCLHVGRRDGRDVADGRLRHEADGDAHGQANRAGEDAVCRDELLVTSAAGLLEEQLQQPERVAGQRRRVERVVLLQELLDALRPFEVGRGALHRGAGELGDRRRQRRGTDHGGAATTGGRGGEQRLVGHARDDVERDLLIRREAGRHEQTRPGRVDGDREGRAHHLTRCRQPVAGKVAHVEHDLLGVGQRTAGHELATGRSEVGGRHPGLTIEARKRDQRPTLERGSGRREERRGGLARAELVEPGQRAELLLDLLDGVVRPRVVPARRRATTDDERHERGGEHRTRDAERRRSRNGCRRGRCLAPREPEHDDREHDERRQHGRRGRARWGTEQREDAEQRHRWRERGDLEAPTTHELSRDRRRERRHHRDERDPRWRQRCRPARLQHDAHAVERRPRGVTRAATDASGRQHTRADDDQQQSRGRRCPGQRHRDRCKCNDRAGADREQRRPSRVAALEHAAGEQRGDEHKTLRREHERHGRRREPQRRPRAHDARPAFQRSTNCSAVWTSTVVAARRENAVFAGTTRTTTACGRSRLTPSNVRTMIESRPLTRYT